MIDVDRALFSNVATSVQRTANLPGGGVSGLPGGVIIRGLQGVGSFAADLQDAQKEYELGRVRMALERVRQLDSQFQSILGRWSASVNNVLSSARAGSQQLPMQKMNEVKNAQTKMQQLSRPASRAFQDLVTALEIAVTNEGRTEIADESDSNGENKEADGPPGDPATAKANEEAEEEREHQASDQPDPNLLGQYATNYRFGDKLEIRKDADGKSRVTPAIEPNKFYFFQAKKLRRVLRVREVRRDAILVFDTHYGSESTIDTKQLKSLLNDGIWRLQPKS